MLGTNDLLERAEDAMDTQIRLGEQWPKAAMFTLKAEQFRGYELGVLRSRMLRS